MLRARTMADFDACLMMDRDPEVTQYISGPWRDPIEHDAFLKSRIETSFGQGLGYWSIFTKQQQFVGWVMLIPYDGVGPKTEIGWRLNKAAWGRGFASEASRLIAEHAFSISSIDRIVADINPQNQPSIRVAEKIGMKFIADGEHGNEICKCYAMTKSDLIPALQ